MSEFNFLLEVQDLWVRFGGLVANQKINFEIGRGEVVGLIGPNGAGKTTCFNVITGVYLPSQGKIFFKGKEISGLAPHKIAQSGLARTFQNIRLFKEMTVLENLLVSLHKTRGYSIASAFLRLASVRRREKFLHDKAMGVLQALGLEKHSHTLAKNLPYGDQRKVEIARALATDPELLLLDEPAAGMNPSETAKLAHLILEIREKFKVTVLLIEHDMSLVMKICERIYVLDYGQLIAQGVPSEIQKNPKVIEAYLGGALNLDETKS